MRRSLHASSTIRSKFISSFQKLIFEKTLLSKSKKKIIEISGRSPDQRMTLNTERKPVLPKIFKDECNVHQQLETVTHVFGKKLGIKGIGSRNKDKLHMTLPIKNIYSSYLAYPSVLGDETSRLMSQELRAEEKKITENPKQFKFCDDIGNDYLKDIMNSPIEKIGLDRKSSERISYRNLLKSKKI